VHNSLHEHIDAWRNAGIAVAFARGSGMGRMTARRVEVAQQQAPMERLEITWGELGCPTETGFYRALGGQVRVRRIHIVVAENDPAALFTVLAFHPPEGATEFALGYRLA
jgi:hypothetical protein